MFDTSVTSARGSAVAVGVGVDVAPPCAWDRSNGAENNPATMTPTAATASDVHNSRLNHKNTNPQDDPRSVRSLRIADTSSPCLLNMAA